LVTGVVIGIYRLTAGVEVDLSEVLELVVPHVRGAFYPEYNERMAYIAYIFAVPVIPLLLAVYLFFAKIKPRTEKLIYRIDGSLAMISWGLILLFTFVFLARDNMHLFLMESRVFNGINLLFGLIICGFICIYLVHSKYKEVLTWFLVALCVGITGFTLFFMIWRTGNAHEHNHHYTAYVSSIAAVLYGGRTLLVDYFPQYGLYAYFLAPIFRIFHFNVASISIVMSVLMLVALACNYMTLTILVKDKLLRLLAYFNIVYFAVYFHKIVLAGSSPALALDTYYQYFPHRFLFPSIIALLFVRYAKISLAAAKEPRRENIALGLLILFTFMGVVWNFDSGLVAFGAVLVGMGFITLGKCIEERPGFAGIAKKWAGFGLYLAGVPLLSYVFLVIVTFARTGSVFINFAHMFFHQSVFYNYGFFMIRMPYVHPWALLALVYIVGISVPVVRFVQSIKERAGLSLEYVCLLFLSVMGVGLFSYYQGRSHNYNLNSVLVYLFPVLALLLDKMDSFFPAHDYIKPVSKKKLSILPSAKLSCFAIVFLLFLQPFGALINFSGAVSAARFRMYALNQRTHSTWAESLLPYIEGEDELIILAYREAYIASQIGRFTSIGESSFIEMFRMEALEQIRTELMENTDRLVLIDTGMAQVASYYSDIVFSPQYMRIWNYGSLSLMKPITGIVD